MKKYDRDRTHQAAAIVTGELRTLLSGGLASYRNRRMSEAGLNLAPHEGKPGGPIIVTDPDAKNLSAMPHPICKFPRAADADPAEVRMILFNGNARMPDAFERADTTREMETMTSRFDDIDQGTLDQYGEVAADAATRSFQFLRFTGSPPEWIIGKTTIITGEEAIALADESAMGWVRFKNNKPVEEHWVQQLGNKKPSRPDSFHDQAKWETWNDGRPKDPWTFKTRLALKITTGELAGKVVLFNGENEGSRTAVGDVQTAFKEKRRRPLVKLTSMKRDGENVTDPVFRIVSFTEDDSVVPGLTLARDSVVADDPRPSVNGGGSSSMDDDIPFAAEFR
jgi:hypothetical protein